MSECYNCGEIGHIARKCTNKYSNNSESINGTFVTGRVFFRSTKGSSKKPIPNNQCFKCNKIGHIARDCESENVVCFNCAEEGHLVKDCSAQIHKACYNCKSDDHLIKECPITNQINSMKTTKVSVENHNSPTVNLKSPIDDQIHKACYNCKSDDHLIKECPINMQMPSKKTTKSSLENQNSPTVNLKSSIDDQKSPSRSNTPVINSVKNFQCYKCHQYGHIARNCHQSSSREIVCFTCNSHGHFARDCQSDACYRCNRTGHLARDCNFY